MAKDLSFGAARETRTPWDRVFGPVTKPHN